MRLPIETFYIKQFLMKTFEQIRSEVISDISVSEMMGADKKCSFADVERQAAKEYAKQWVEQVVKEISDVPPGNLITYYHLAIDAQ